MKLNWFTIFPWAAIIILMFILLRGYRQYDKLDEERAGIQKTFDSLKNIAVNVSRGTDSIIAKNTKDSVRYVTVIDSLKGIISLWQARFNTTKNNLINLSKQYSQFRHSGDTVLALVTCDSIIVQLQLARDEIAELNHNQDTTITVLGNEVDRLNEVIKGLEASVSEYKAIVAGDEDLVGKLQNDVKIAERKAKRNGIFAKIGAGIGIALVLLLVTK